LIDLNLHFFVFILFCVFFNHGHNHIVCYDVDFNFSYFSLSSFRFVLSELVN
jgi:hypothetical protein